MADTTGKVKIISKQLWVSALIVSAFFAVYYLTLLYMRIETDVQAHLIVSYKFVNEGGTLTPNFLYFLLVALFAGFSKYKILYYLSSVLIIAVALGAKFLLNYFYIKKSSVSNPIERRKPLFLSVGLLFVFCLPGVDFFKSNDFFLGLLAPNVWHNSTAIFLFPFAIALFFETYFFLYAIQPVNKNRLVLIGALIVLNVLIKPSFLFTIIPAVFFSLIIAKKREALLSMIFLYGGGLLLVLLQYLIIYKLQKPVEQCTNCSESVIVEPFSVWKHYSSNIPVSFLCSFLFPVVFFILSKGQILKDKLVRFAVINWFFALLIYILFAESGERKFHGNFSWQLVMGNYLLFFVLGLSLWNTEIVNKLSLKTIRILQLLLGLHIVWGVGYFLKILVFRNYD